MRFNRESLGGEPGIVDLLFLAVLPAVVVGTPYYYGMYKSYGTGDTVITTTHANGGTMLPNKKWQVECFDGEAMVGISDNIWDFAALTYVWCKFMFPFKPPSQGVYPYYSNCHVNDYVFQFFCYSPTNHSTTANTFVTGMWDKDFVWWTWSATDLIQPYKCCRVPRGYYIDYVSCYYLPTHDLYWEYYDGNLFLVNCATGYVMTGAAAKINPIHKERRIDWIQCCRVGWGAVISVAPPVTYGNGRPPSYTTSNVSPISIPQSYSHQYRKKRSIPNYVDNVIEVGNSTVFVEDALTENELPLPKRKGFGYTGLVTDHDVPYTQPEMNIPMVIQQR